MNFNLGFALFLIMYLITNEKKKLKTFKNKKPLMEK